MKNVRKTDNDILMPIVLESINSGNDARLKISGFSMYPLVTNWRDSVLLTKADKIKKGDKETNRPIFAIYDEVNNVMYLKEIDIIQKRKHIEEKYILKDKKDKKYEIIKIEENKFDYLLKSKKGYKTISCYKILLKRI